ncbi:ATP-binding protein [Bacillus sp. SCS-151]|uniref:ATP-binding protein n=1 Tax=Nanhaiella sioensis TaxID=3115293 RepID=UPI00397D6CF3
MIHKFHRLSFFKKTLIFSSVFIIFLGTATAVISYQIQKNATIQLLSESAMNLSNLWKETLAPEDVTLIKSNQEINSPSRTHIIDLLNHIHENYSMYSRAYLLDFDRNNYNSYHVIVDSEHNIQGDREHEHHLHNNKEYTNAFSTAIVENKSAATGLYKDQMGLWITAFTPIVDDEENIIAVLAIDLDATEIQGDLRNLLISLFISFVILFSIILKIQQWGFSKMMDPLKQLFEGVYQVSRGNFDVKLSYVDTSELGYLRDEFNSMVGHLRTIFERVQVTAEHFGKRTYATRQLHGFEKAIGEIDEIIHQTKLQKELQRAEKMNAIGQMAASVAHEIRNPMTVVKGFLQIFLANENIKSQEREFIHLMINELNRAETIINDYLSLAKPDVGECAEVNCSDIVKNVTDIVNSYALMKNNISIIEHVEEGLYVKGNKGELKQVLLNIMKNGIEAMKAEGELSVICVKDSSYVRIEITDSGIGMTQDELDRLGTPFYSLKEKGTGIGLMVCYQIIEQMKGKIIVESIKNKGTTFSLYLPIVN